MKAKTPNDEIYRIIYTEHHDPFTVLGIHQITHRGQPAVIVRAFLPRAASAFVLRMDGDAVAEETPMNRVHDDGFFEALYTKRGEVFPYKLKYVSHSGSTEVFWDSYAFLPQLTQFDLHLFAEGNHFRIFDKLGAHHRTINGVDGIEFTVWAPNARSVSVIGSFNSWDRRHHAMRVLGSSGVWEIFIPGIGDGELYKYEIKTREGYVLDKTDPYATAMEERPRTASIVHTFDGHQWCDDAWMERRRATDLRSQPVSVYEVHLASWRRRIDDATGRITYADLAEELVRYVSRTGYTHVELMPIMEHPFDGSWGYQVTGYYAPTSRFGPPDEFRLLIDNLHQAGIGVFLDWVPAHFPKDAHALGLFDGSHLYEHQDPRKGEHMDWGTFIFNYGRNEVKNFLIANALFWIERFHIDGLRIDAVASMLYLDYSRKDGEWLPNKHGGRENLEAIDFLRQLNLMISMNHPGVAVIAEESTAFTGVTHPVDHNGLGFDFKWNMGWMHDTLEYFQKDPLFRKYHHNNLTFSLLYAFNEQFLLPISHDEVVHGKGSLISKMPGDYWQKFANTRLFWGFMYAHPGKKLMFMGQDIGQWNEWNHDTQLDWSLLNYPAHRQLLDWVCDLNRTYRSEPSMYEVDGSWEGFQWIDFNDSERSLLSFERIARDGRERLVFLLNFTPSVHEGYRLGVPAAGRYRELLNSDAESYGGSGVGNYGGVQSEDVPWHDRPASVVLRVPPLGMLVLKLEA